MLWTQSFGGLNEQLHGLSVWGEICHRFSLSVMDMYCEIASQKTRNRQVVKGMKDLLHLAKREGVHHDEGVGKGTGE